VLKTSFFTNVGGTIGFVRVSKIPEELNAMILFATLIRFGIGFGLAGLGGGMETANPPPCSMKYEPLFLTIVLLTIEREDVAFRGANA
jgi:hypothetical protein